METPRQFLKLLLLAASAFIFTQCGSDDPKPTKKTDVYVAGRYNNGTTIVPAYWKNGEVVVLSDAAGEADAIAVVGDNVYVIGDLDDNSNKKRLWTNKVMTDFSDGAVNTSTNVYSMRVIGTDWYAVGLKSDLNGDHATYWKNGVAHTVSTIGINARAYDIAIDGNDVYVVGFYYNTDGYAVAAYWKNGNANDLTDGTSSADADGIVIHEGHVYISGNNNGTIVAWKDKVPLTLANPESAYTATASIVVLNNDVYIVGYQSDQPKYWKNGTAVPMSTPEGATGAYGYTLALDGNNIFCLGEAYVDGIYRALVWKNFELVAPFDGTEVSTGYGMSVAH